MATPSPNILMYVKTVEGRKIPIEVNSDDSIHSVKLKIQLKEGLLKSNFPYF
jgi:hypothetical protein